MSAHTVSFYPQVRDPIYPYGMNRRSVTQQPWAQRSALGAYASAQRDIQDSQDQAGSTSARQGILKQLQSLRSQPQEPENPYVLSAGSIVDKLFGSKADENKQEELLPKNNSYNVNQVANKIQSAKTSMSAGKAALSASRKVQELKRKLANADDDTTELELALNHAKRMERVARKKQRNLELEELVEATGKRDESLKEQEDQAQSAEDMQAVVAELSEDELSDRQAALDEVETSLFSELADGMRSQMGDGAELSDEMIAQIDAMVESMTEEERAFLDEQEELLQSMEVVDPHMSSEQLQKLKLRHRTSENKEIVKAHSEYYKGLMRYYSEHGAQTPGMGGGTSAPLMAAVSLVQASPQVSAPMIDIQA